MNGFISYAHDDYRMFRSVRTQMKSVERAFGIRFWSDQRINAGYVWDTEIRRHIDVADLFVLLVSPAFLASDYIWDQELPAIISRRDSAKTVLVLPIVLTPCMWTLVAAHRQAVPTENGHLQPIADWKPQRNGYDAARGQIAAAIEAFYGRAPKSLFV